MTRHQDDDRAEGGPPHSLPVRFDFTDPEAVSVYIAGTFNNGQPNAKPMDPVGNSRWVREIVLPIGTNEFGLVAEWEFRPDPLAGEAVPNRFGGVNSILRVANEEEPVRFSSRELSQVKWRNK
jgi:hypothetical protein